MSRANRPSGWLETLRNRYHAIVDEMSIVLMRTGHTVFIKETGDFSCALVTPTGEVFCAPTRLGMIRIVGMNMATAIEAAGHPEEGDIWIANDPWTTGGMSTHLPDVFLWQPVLLDGELLCYVWSFIHVSDIGGRVPGSISPASAEIFEEGLIIPPVRLYQKGELNREILSLVLANTRIENQVWGDIKAAVAALNIGKRRILELARRYGGTELSQGQEGLIEWASERAGELFRRIPNGQYHFWDYMEGVPGVQDPFRIAVTLEARDGRVHLDFTGTSRQVACAYNIPTGGQGPHYYLTTALVTLLRTWDRNIPYNGGLVRPVSVSLPAGSVVNPSRGAAIGVRAATMHRIYDVVMGCLAQALPGAIPAAGAGQGPVVVLSVPSDLPGKRKVSVVQPLRGGSGARPKFDGVDGVDITVGSGRNIPTEVLEREMPLRIVRYGLRPDSGGKGTYRGGLGLELEFEVLCDGAKVTCRGLERHYFRPWGLAGGRPGALGRTQLNRGRPGERDIGRFDLLELQRGDRLYFATPGGGGYGLVSERSPEAILADVDQGKITGENIAEYRTPDHVTVEGTLVEQVGRGQSTSSNNPPHAKCEGVGIPNTITNSAILFDFGPERHEYESSMHVDGQP